MKEIKMYGIYKKRNDIKNAPTYLLETCDTEKMAKQICAEYNEIMALNGYDKVNTYFYKEIKTNQ
jgi:hypothetical protein